MDITIKLSLVCFLVCVLISLKSQRESRAVLELEDPWDRRDLGEDESPSGAVMLEELEYDYYRQSCPSAEQIVRLTVRELYDVNMSVAPALLRLLFHDCFVMGCDASIMLDSDGKIKSEKEATPNGSIKGFEQIDLIKSKLEEACPGVVSCADILALAARDSLLLTGGQFYPVLTGRKDSIDAFPSKSAVELPRPDDDFKTALATFASKGFDARETVALLGAHSTGKIHCNFIRKRLFNFTGTNQPDSSINAEFLEVLRSECGHSAPTQSASVSPSPSSAENRSPAAAVEDQAMRMDYDGPGKGFGEVYYRSLLQGKGLLFVDQQLAIGPETKPWVETYASDVPSFRRDFGLAMFKLSHLQVAKKGQVRLNCRRLN